jgi:ubiquinone/menaquinone biosynthesis C-methylase UbiE
MAGQPHDFEIYPQKAMEHTMTNTLKERVHDFWNADPCAMRYTTHPVGTREFYDEVEKFRYWVQPWHRRIAEFDQHWGESVLEIGCGMGTDALQFAKGGATVNVVDLTEAAIDITRKRFNLYGYMLGSQVADAENLPYSDNIFDVVYSFGVLHHTPDTEKALHEAVRVLKPGGRLIVMLYHTHSLHTFLGSLTYGRKEWVRLADGPNNPLGKSYTRKQVRAMIPIPLTFETVEGIHRHWPVWMNWIYQVLTWRNGFFLIAKGSK